MVEGQAGQRIEGEPLGLGCIVAANGLPLCVVKAPKGDADGAVTRVAVRLTKGTELMQTDACQSSLFLQFSCRTGFQVLLHLQKATWQGPATFERFVAPLNKQQAPYRIYLSENQTISCNTRTRIIVSKTHDNLFFGKDRINFLSLHQFKALKPVEGPIYYEKPQHRLYPSRPQMGRQGG